MYYFIFCNLHLILNVWNLAKCVGHLFYFCSLLLISYFIFLDVHDDMKMIVEFYFHFLFKKRTCGKWNNQVRQNVSDWCNMASATLRLANPQCGRVIHAVGYKPKCSINFTKRLYWNLKSLNHCTEVNSCALSLQSWTFFVFSINGWPPPKKK